ncbi:MAG: heme-binding beta-barrel domain-containing protein [Verrucomicrobiales bacterium]|nr:heme-binding beta-barrel domain-containing protein [Verrucomicrobiales bacterium]
MHIDYGPLTGLIGTWQGTRGLDVSPEPDDGTEINPYYETITFEAAGDVDNAESQKLIVVRYHQVVQRKSNDEIFHDQVGHWMWDPKTGVVMQSLSIPRGVCLVAGGEAKTDDDTTTLNVAAKLGDPDWGIVESPFMRDNASTLEYRHQMIISPDRLSYDQTTVLDIYGRRFDHTDKSVLNKV